MIDKIEVDGLEYDVNDPRVDNLSSGIEVVDLDTLTAEKFRELSPKFMAGEIQILVRDGERAYLVNNVYYREEDYSRWGCTYVAYSQVDTYADPTLYYVQIIVSHDNSISKDKGQISLEEFGKKVYAHRIEINDSHFRGTFTFLCKYNSIFTTMADLVDYKEEITHTAVLQGMQADMSGEGDWGYGIRISADEDALRLYVIFDFLRDPADANERSLAYRYDITVSDTCVEVN